MKRRIIYTIMVLLCISSFIFIFISCDKKTSEDRFIYIYDSVKNNGLYEEGQSNEETRVVSDIDNNMQIYIFPNDLSEDRKIWISYYKINDTEDVAARDIAYFVIGKDLKMQYFFTRTYMQNDEEIKVYAEIEKENISFSNYKELLGNLQYKGSNEKEDVEIAGYYAKSALISIEKFFKAHQEYGISLSYFGFKKYNY